MYIGDKIKELRQFRKMSQKMLCKDICSQSLISQIENNEIYPSTLIVAKLTQKLGIDANYLLDPTSNGRTDYFETLKMAIEEAKRKRDYEEVKRMVTLELSNPIFKNPNLKQWLLWHKAIAHYYADKNFDSSIDILIEALNINGEHSIFNEVEVNILLSIGIIHSEYKFYDLALKYYQQVYKQIKENPASLIKSKTRIKYYYNKALTLSNTNQYETSHHVCQAGMKLALKEESLYLLGELIYLLGYTLKNYGDLEETKTYFQQAKMLFEIQKQVHLLPFVDEQLASVMNLGGPKNG